MSTHTPPMISVIIGVLNMQKYFKKTLESLIHQDYPHFEIIVMDGGSTDGTIDIIRHYEKHIAYWKSEKDKGHADACNKAVPIAKGDYITFLNADDVYDNNLLKKVAETVKHHPNSRVITCGVHIIEWNNSLKQYKTIQTITDSQKLSLSLHNMLFELPVINARFFHKNIFTEFGYFKSNHPDGSYNLSNDRDFLIKLALASVSTEIIPEPLYHYLSHDESLTFSNKHAIKSRFEHIALAEHHLNYSRLTHQEKDLFLRWLKNESAYLFFISLRQRKMKVSFYSFKIALKYCGFSWFWHCIRILQSTLSRRIFKTSIKVVP